MFRQEAEIKTKPTPTSPPTQIHTPLALEIGS